MFRQTAAAAGKFLHIPDEKQQFASTHRSIPAARPASRNELLNSLTNPGQFEPRRERVGI
jgi:hypothetical protein